MAGLLWLLAGSPAAGQRNAEGPLAAELHEVSMQPFNRTVQAVGTLRANESVTLVPELARRLVDISFEEGSTVEAGELMFKLDESELVAELREIDARIRLARANKDRATALLPKEAISRREYDLAESELEVLEAQRALKAVELAKTEIRAPFAGRVGTRRVSVGAVVSASTPLVDLQDLASLKVDFPLPERYMPEVRPGQEFTFTVTGSGDVHQGRITVIEPVIDAATRSLQVRGICQQPGGLLPGGFAEVTLAIEDGGESILIPTQALIPSPRGQGVFRIRDGRAELQPVEIGTRTPNEVQILRGLDEGDVIAITNLLRIRPGSEVISVKSSQP